MDPHDLPGPTYYLSMGLGLQLCDFGRYRHCSLGWHVDVSVAGASISRPDCLCPILSGTCARLLGHYRRDVVHPSQASDHWIRTWMLLRGQYPLHIPGKLYAQPRPSKPGWQMRLRLGWHRVRLPGHGLHLATRDEESVLPRDRYSVQASCSGAQVDEDNRRHQRRPLDAYATGRRPRILAMVKAARLPGNVEVSAVKGAGEARS